jgi:hypothetical protein
MDARNVAAFTKTVTFTGQSRRSLYKLGEMRENEKKRQPSLLRSRADPKLRRMLPSMSACRNSPAPEDSPMAFPRRSELQPSADLDQVALGLSDHTNTSPRLFQPTRLFRL